MQQFVFPSERSTQHHAVREAGVRGWASHQPQPCPSTDPQPRHSTEPGVADQPPDTGSGQPGMIDTLSGQSGIIVHQGLSFPLEKEGEKFLYLWHNLFTMTRQLPFFFCGVILILNTFTPEIFQFRPLYISR